MPFKENLDALTRHKHYRGTLTEHSQEIITNELEGDNPFGFNGLPPPPPLFALDPNNSHHFFVFVVETRSDGMFSGKFGMIRRGIITDSGYQMLSNDDEPYIKVENADLDECVDAFFIQHGKIKQQLQIEHHDHFLKSMKDVAELHNIIPIPGFYKIVLNKEKPNTFIIYANIKGKITPCHGEIIHQKIPNSKERLWGFSIRLEDMPEHIHVQRPTLKYCLNAFLVQLEKKRGFPSAEQIEFNHTLFKRVSDNDWHKVIDSMHCGWPRHYYGFSMGWPRGNYKGKDDKDVYAAMLKFAVLHAKVTGLEGLLGDGLAADHYIEKFHIDDALKRELYTLAKAHKNSSDGEKILSLLQKYLGKAPEPLVSNTENSGNVISTTLLSDTLVSKPCNSEAENKNQQAGDRKSSREAQVTNTPAIPSGENTKNVDSSQELIQRLERRVQELEALLATQQSVQSMPGVQRASAISAASAASAAPAATPAIPAPSAAIPAAPAEISASPPEQQALPPGQENGRIIVHSSSRRRTLIL